MTTRNREDSWRAQYLTRRAAERHQQEIRVRSNQDAMSDELALGTMIALDALEQGHPDTSKLLVGVPATIITYSKTSANEKQVHGRITKVDMNLCRIEVQTDSSYSVFWRCARNEYWSGAGGRLLIGVLK